MKGENLFGKPIDLNMGNIGGQVVNKIAKGKQPHSQFCLEIILMTATLNFGSLLS